MVRWGFSEDLRNQALIRSNIFCYASLVAQQLRITGAEDMGSILGSRRFPGGGNGNPLPVFLPGKSHRQRSLVGYSPQGLEELDRT